jgi:MFS transporter, DHA2 family, multidrug resistance protein
MPKGRASYAGSDPLGLEQSMKMNPQAAPVNCDGLATPRRHWSIAAIWLAMTMAVLDSVIANIALPTIANDLGSGAATAISVINAYQIPVVMLILPLAAAGEIYGYRRIYLIGVFVFALASLGCCTATGLNSLTAWRFAQGIGGAAIMAVNGALIRMTFPSNQLGRGIGYNAIVVSISSAAGPTIAAVVLAVASWRWLFAINIPIGLTVVAISGLLALPSGERASRLFDWRSTVLSAALFGALFLLSGELVSGRAGIKTAVCLLVALGAAIALFRTACTQANPMAPVDLLRMPSLRTSYIASICAFAGQMTGLVALPFYLQSRFGQVAMGLLFTGFPIGFVFGAPLSGLLSDRLPSLPLGIIGLTCFALGYLLLSLNGGGAAAWIVGSLIVAGFGMGLFQSPNNRLMLSEAPRHRMGGRLIFASKSDGRISR